MAEKKYFSKLDILGTEINCKDTEGRESIDMLISQVNSLQTTLNSVKSSLENLTTSNSSDHRVYSTTITNQGKDISAIKTTNSSQDSKISALESWKNGLISYTQYTDGSKITTNGSVALSSMQACIYRIDTLIYFEFVGKVANSNDGAWKLKFNDFPLAVGYGKSYIFNCYKDTGVYIPCYSDSNGWIVHQGGTGAYTIHIAGNYLVE